MSGPLGSDVERDVREELADVALEVEPGVKALGEMPSTSAARAAPRDFRTIGSPMPSMEVVVERTLG